MPAVKITNKPIGIPGDDTHFIVTQPELPEGYTPTGQETEEELAELKVESLREIEMDDMVELIQDKLDMDVTPTTGSSKPVTSGGIKAALDLMDDDISSLNEDITNSLDSVDAEIGELKENLNGLETGIIKDTTLLKGLVFNEYGLNRTHGYIANSRTNELHTPLQYCNGKVWVVVPSGYKYSIFYFDQNGYVSNSYDIRSTWFKGITLVDYTGLISVVISKDDETDFTEQECLDLNNTVYIYSDDAIRIGGIAFGVGHIDTSDRDYWGLHGNDYIYTNLEINPDMYKRWRSERQDIYYKGTTVDIAPGYRFYIFKYQNGTVVNGNWLTTKYTFAEDTYARIIVDTTSSTKTPYTEWPDLTSVINISIPDVKSIDDYNEDMSGSLVSLSGYNTLASGDWTNPVPKKKNICFPVITDVHGSNGALHRFFEYANAHEKYFDFCLGLGDFVVRQPSESTEWVDAELNTSQIPYYYTVGNHDAADSGLSGITQEAARTKYFSTIESKGWLQSSDFMGSGKCSWSKDFSAYHIRIVSLFEYGNADTMSSGAPGSYCRRWMDSDLLQWFADTLYSTPAGYSVIVLLHQMPYAPMTFVNNPFTVTENIAYAPSHWNSLFLNTIDGNPIEEIVNAFKNSTAISKTYNSISSYGLGKSATVSKDYSGRAENGKFIAYFAGHTHASYVLKSQTYPDQISIIVPTGSENIFQRNYGDMLYDAETRNKDNFYCVGIDTDLKTINISKIGGQITTDMRERVITSIQYA